MSSVSTAELNLELKPQAKIEFQLIPRCFAYGSPRVEFLRQKLNDPSNFN